MRKRIVAGNWKMNTTLQEGVELAKSINEEVKKSNENIGVVIAPPFTHLIAVKEVINSERICLAAQNCASETKGAYTGEVSVQMLKSLGVKAIIIGHSERRAYYGENNGILNKKVKLTISEGLKAIYCCGETLDERQSGKLFEIIESQIVEGIFNLSIEDIKNVIIAYEPVWAIGTGVTASSEQAQEMHAFIRNLVHNKYGKEVANEIKILYGGSVKPDNATELFNKEDVDGGLIGGASLKTSDFMAIVNA